VAQSPVRVVGPQSSEDASHSYYVSLLSKALQANNHKTSDIAAFNQLTEVTHGRSLHLLANKEIDVYWAGTSVERETQFLPIKIPLFRGLLGYRVSIVKQIELSNLKRLPLAELKRKIACQGEHWPDTRILQYNGYKVMPVARFDLMFKMVEAGRCDYFPRALFEGFGELEKAQKTLPELTMWDDTILHYPFPIYFFVHRDNTKLADTIKQGLLALQKTGEFDRFMQTHSLTQHLFPLDKWQDKRIIELLNPFLPEGTDTKNPELWFHFK
jgi:hypothetical protein